MDKNESTGDFLHTMEVPLMEGNPAAGCLCFYYSFHPDQRKRSWKTRTDHQCSFRAVSFRINGHEFYLDRKLHSLGFFIHSGAISRILKEHHFNTLKHKT